MRSASLIATIAVLGLLVTSPAIPAGPDKCVLEGTNLSCGDQKATRADYFRRFSNPQTTKDLIGMLEKFPLFEDGKQRESYRRSLERIWRAVTRHGREQKRRYLRRQLTGEAYKKVEADFEQARKSYEAGINLYRNHILKPEGSIDRPAKPSG